MISASVLKELRSKKKVLKVKKWKGCRTKNKIVELKKGFRSKQKGFESKKRL